MVRDVAKWRVGDQLEYVGENLTYGTPTSSHLRRYVYRRSLEAMRSEGHPYFYLGKSSLDLGGPFDLLRSAVSGRLEPQLLRSIGVNNQYANEYKTIVVPSSAVSSMLNGISGPSTEQEARNLLLTKLTTGRPSETTLDAVGAKFINILNPTNPVADTATTVAEFLSERKFFSLPSKGSTVEGEYLNYMFGVAPTVSFAKDFREAARTQDKVLSQLWRDSGKWVRRQAHWEPTRETSKTVTQAYPVGFGQPISTAVAKMGRLTTVTRQYQKYWFSGAFTYHLPKEGRGRTLAELDALYGVRPTAQSTAWELMPFSWLLDYKVSLGDSIQNLDAFAEYHIVMPYAYVMCHTRTEVEYTWEGELRGPDGNWRAEVLSNTVNTESKQRRGAHPFGFGVSAGNLSPQQYSILAALGITLVRRK